MDIGFSEEQALLRETARRLLENHGDTRLVRHLMAEPTAVTDGFCQKLGEQGVLGRVYPKGGGGRGPGRHRPGVLRNAPTLSRSGHAPGTAARWRTASVCSSCRGTRLSSPAIYCRRSTRPVNYARSGSTTPQFRPARCSAKYIRVGRRCLG